MRRFGVKCGAAMAALLIGCASLVRAAELPPAKPLVVPVLPYEPGSWGPAQAVDLMADVGGGWIDPVV